MDTTRKRLAPPPQPNDPRWLEDLPENAHIVGMTISEFGCGQYAQLVDSYGLAYDFYSRSHPDAPFYFYCTKAAWPTSPAAITIAEQRVSRELSSNDDDAAGG